jgi:SNF2 family DNA or RNA helicase
MTEETVYCEMEEEQAACYNEEKSKIRNVLLEQWNKADKSYTAAALSSLTRLRLLANHPAISFPVTKDRRPSSIRSSRKPRPSLQKIQGADLFSFVKHLQLFADYFDRCGWRYAWLTAARPTAGRNREVQ